MTDKQTMFPAVTADAIRNSLQATASAMPNIGDAAYMSYAKGVWTYGVEKDDATLETWAVNPASFQMGIIGWEDGRVVYEEMYPAGQGKTINEEELPAIAEGDSNGYSRQSGLMMKSMESGVQALFKSSSHGGKSAISALSGDILAGMTDARPIAVVKLGTESYQHKKYGLIHKPVFEIVGWADMDGNVEKEKRQLV